MSANPSTTAPKERKKIAPGKERSIAALRHEFQNTSSPDGATQGGVLPMGWQQMTLGMECNIFAGFGFPERFQGKSSGDLPFFKVGDISETWKRGDVFLTRANHYVSHADSRELRAKPLPTNTTVFAKIGAAIALNRRAILSEPSLVDNNVMGIHPGSDKLDYKFLFYFICTLKLDDLSRATTVPSIRKSDIEAIAIPVPPLPDQRRIVAEIEKQFTRLDVGVAALMGVQANIKRYRAAVLKAACEGRLVPTEAELAKTGRRKSNFETGKALLARILTERRQNWKGRGKYKEPATPDTAKLSALSEGWIWASVGQLGDVQLGRQRSPKNVSKDYPTKYIRAANITEGGIDISNVLEMEFSPAERERFALCNGDIVLSEASGSPSQVGKPAIWRDELPLCCFQNTVLRLRPVVVVERYVLIAFQHFYANSVFAKVAGGVGINHLGAKKFSAIPFPLPPLDEQTRIVAEAERRLSVLEELETLVSANLQRATHLRQSILQIAFNGNLVSQNSVDEPAELLLERVKDLPNVARAVKRKTIPKDRNIMQSNPVVTLKELLQCLESIGGAAAPDRLLAITGLSDTIDSFFDLLREGRDNGVMIVPTGINGDIKLNSHEN